MSREKKKQDRKKKIKKISNMQKNNGYLHVSPIGRLGKRNIRPQRKNRRVHGRRFG